MFLTVAVPIVCRRSKYLGLQILLPTVGSKYLLNIHPELIRSLLDAVGATKMASGASQLLIRLLDAYGTEWQEKHRGTRG